MIYNTIIIRFGELTTKGKNRKDFINKLATSIDKALFEYKGTYSLDVRHDHIYINILDYGRLMFGTFRERASMYRTYEAPPVIPQTNFNIRYP